jgi:glycosyltransferase involved in cell wall biosynthesis
MDLSIVMPCLNEAETLAGCIAKAKEGIRLSGASGEIVIADNGSTDGSQNIAIALGARVVNVNEKGYGNALRGGIQASLGKWIVMGDADDSYDFTESPKFLENLRNGDDLVMGCRLPSGGGRVVPGAMPWKNRWIGNPILTFIGRLLFKCPAHDFHCGLRGFSRGAFEKMDLRTTGMEFASEMVIKATLKKLTISEVPITLHKDGRSRPPHLKPWRDGWRHLRFMLLYSPRWLFLIPGMLMMFAGLIFTAILAFKNVSFAGVELSVGSLMVSCMAMMLGFQLVAFAFYTKIFATLEGLMPKNPGFERLFQFLTLERGLLVSFFVLSLGSIILLRSLWLWKEADFGQLPWEQNLRGILLSATMIVLGFQGIFSSFFLSVLGMGKIK